MRVVRRRLRFAKSALLASAACVIAEALGGCSRATAEFSLPADASNALLYSQPRVGYRVIFNFGSNVNGLDGAYPVAPLIYANSLFYGTTEYGGSFDGGGTVFRMSTTGRNEQVLHSFAGGPYEGGPVAGVIKIGETLYGTAPGGGRYNQGTVFAIRTNGTNERVLHSFGGGSDGMDPRASVVAVRDKLYGTTFQGGKYGRGVVFSVRIANGAEHVLHSFSGPPDGDDPLAGLIVVNGVLYGTTQTGGSNGQGCVFSITARGSERVIYSFGGLDGETAMASLIDTGATLYGTTAAGGEFNNGVVFSMSLSGTNERVLHSFGGSGDGIEPLAPVVAVNGTLYGTTYEGGALGYGTVYRVGSDGAERVLHSFGSGQNDGIYPEAGLVNINRTLYGTTYEGGISPPSCPKSGGCAFGTVFALTR
jgi:uncharacterized repeat protein (TIGR03803 family)